MVDYRDKAKQTSLEETIRRFGHIVNSYAPVKNNQDEQCQANLRTGFLEARVGFFETLEQLKKEDETVIRTNTVFEKLRTHYNTLNKAKKIDEKATQQAPPA